MSFHGYGGVDIAEGLSSPAIHPQDSRLVQLLSLQMTSKVYLQAWPLLWAADMYVYLLIQSLYSNGQKDLY